MQHYIQIYEAQKHSSNNQINQIYFGGLHNLSSLLKKENLSLLRDLVNTSIIYLKTLIMCEDVPPPGTSSTYLKLIFMHTKSCIN